MAEDKKIYNCDGLRTPEERQAWKDSCRVWIIPERSTTVSYPNGSAYYGDAPRPQQSKETTDMIKRQLEQQYKQKELLRKLFG